MAYFLTDQGNEYLASLASGKERPTLIDGSEVPDKKIKGTTLFVLHQIIYRVNWKNGTFWPSINTLTRLCGCNYSTAHKAVKALKEAGIIKAIGKQKKGVIHYAFLLHMPEGTLAGKSMELRTNWELEKMKRLYGKNPDRHDDEEVRKNSRPPCHEKTDMRLSRKSPDRQSLTISNDLGHKYEIPHYDQEPSTIREHRIWMHKQGIPDHTTQDSKLGKND